jgi:hypothetical protein
VFLQRIDDFEDEHRVVGDDADLHPRRQLRLDLVGEFLLDALGDGHGVGVGDLDHAEAHRHLAVEARQLAVVGEPVVEFGDIAEAHRDAVALRQYQAAQRVEGMEFEVELDQVLGGLADDEAAGQLHVLGGEGVGDVLRRDRQRRHALGQQVDADGAVAAAAEAHLADAVDGLQLFLDHVERVLVELLLGAVALQRHPEHRRGVGLDLGDDGRIDVLGQAAQHLANLGLHLVEGDIDVLLQAEGDVDHRDAGRGRGLDVLDAGHAVDRTLDQVGDAGIDDVGIGALQRGGHRDHREFDVGQAVHADAAEGDHAEQHQHRVQHPRQDVALDR